MGRKKILLATFIFNAIALHAQVYYRYQVDLRPVNDRLTVTLHTGSIAEDKIVFKLPAMVPGIYASLDFGRCITGFSATGSNGETLETKKLNTNSWEISNARQLTTISYQVDDDFEDFSTYEGLPYKSPRSMFTADTVFQINTNSLFGYFEGKQKLPFEIKLLKPAHLYAATSLPEKYARKEEAVFFTRDYNQLVDNPILVCRPDTAGFMVGSVKVNIACYSTSGKLMAQKLVQHIQPLINNQKNYLGGKLPVEKYTFLIHHYATQNDSSIFFDGLEHAQSTLILLNMPYNEDMINQSVYSVASHEFFHTIVPLALHSEEIEYYDFGGPTMSKHLWLYEGMTEYFTQHMPIQQGVINMSSFVEQMNEKVKQMNAMKNDIGLAELGKKAVSRQDEYMNAYSRGSLLCMCLDIELRAASKGKYGVQQLIQDMLLRYEPNKPFKDEELFKEMAAVSGYTFIEKFLVTYVDENNLPPLATSLEKAGLEFKQNKITVRKKINQRQLKIQRAWLGLK